MVEVTEKFTQKFIFDSFTHLGIFLFYVLGCFIQASKN